MKDVRDVDGRPVIVDITASVRRKARYRAVKVLAEAGWDWENIALALGVSVGTVVRMMPKRIARRSVEAMWHRPASD